MIYGVYSINGDLHTITASKAVVLGLLRSGTCNKTTTRKHAYEMPITWGGV